MPERRERPLLHALAVRQRRLLKAVRFIVAAWDGTEADAVRALGALQELLDGVPNDHPGV